MKMQKNMQLEIQGQQELPAVLCPHIEGKAASSVCFTISKCSHHTSVIANLFDRARVRGVLLHDTEDNDDRKKQ